MNKEIQIRNQVDDLQQVEAFVEEIGIPLPSE